MKGKKILDYSVGNFRVEMTSIEFAGDPYIRNRMITRRAWRRAVRMLRNFGAEHALELIDARAEAAVDRGDIETAIRWRTLITAIHAIVEDERLFGESLQ